MSETPTTVDGAPPDHPGFVTERLTLSPQAVVKRIEETIGGVTASRTDNGMNFRTPGGTLVALLTPEPEGDEPTVLFQYRTEPEWESETLKARRLWRALEPDTA
jgi:hypothetical protein